MNLFRSEEHARGWPAFLPRSEEGFIALPDLVGFFATESRHHMLEPERRAYLERIGKITPFWLGTPDEARR